MSTTLPDTRTHVLQGWTLSENEPAVISIEGNAYRPHPNGGGMVALTALVSPNVYVGPRAMIRDRAVVVGGVRLFDESIVEEKAVVAGRCTLRGKSRVSGEAVLRDNVTMHDAARADGLVRISGSVKLRHFAHVSIGNMTGGITIS